MLEYSKYNGNEIWLTTIARSMILQFNIHPFRKKNVQKNVFDENSRNTLFRYLMNQIKMLDTQSHADLPDIQFQCAYVHCFHS